MSIRGILVLICIVLFSSCSRQIWKVEEISSPAGPQSSVPYLSAHGGSIYMSWIEQAGDQPILKFASWDGNWSQAQSIVSSKQLFVNWADFPSILPLSNGTLAVHWLQKRGAHKYAYDVMTSISKDRGATWSQPLRVHQDESENEHGFVSLAEAGSEEYSAVWLDSRNYKTSNAMSLMYATFQNGSFQNETLIDARVCDCCQTSVARIPGGIFVIYRDRTEAEIRDINYVRFVNGKWTSPKRIHADEWKIDGCPVNGPAAASSGNNVAVAWYTGARDQPRVYAAFSKDAGETFGVPIRVDSGNPSGRVDIEMLEDGSAVVNWLENRQDQGADIRIRNVFPDGHSSDPIIVADTTNARSSGVPRMTRINEDIFIAWTFASEPPRIRVAKITR